jgi:hypothetical protein
MHTDTEGIHSHRTCPYIQSACAYIQNALSWTGHSVCVRMHSLEPRFVGEIRVTRVQRFSTDKAPCRGTLKKKIASRLNCSALYSTKKSAMVIKLEKVRCVCVY